MAIYGFVNGLALYRFIGGMVKEYVDRYGGVGIISRWVDLGIGNIIIYGILGFVEV